MVKKSIADFAYDILEEKNQPMHYRVITEEVMKIKKINAENPHHNVHAIMGADDRFTKYQRGVWGLVKWKYRDANLSYNLTSYCLRNGTIFLTSYLIPYFGWARDDRNAEVVFIDPNGEEIKATISYRQKLISGFREWFQRMELEVNDTLFIGVADEEKRRYFIIAEKETKTGLEKDQTDEYLSYLKNCFEILGYQTEWNDGTFEKSFFVARALLNYKSYSLVIMGLPTGYHIGMVQAIDWMKVREARKAVNTDSVFLFAETFHIKELIDRASEEGVQLYPARLLDDILEEHRGIPFSLFDLRIAFSPLHHPQNNFDKLIEIRHKQREEWVLMRDIFSIVRAGNDESIPMDFNRLVGQLHKRNKIFQSGSIDQAGVKKVIELFSHEPFSMIEISDTGSMILSLSESIAKMRIQSWLKIIIDGEDKGK